MAQKKVNTKSLPPKQQVLILDYLINPAIFEGEKWSAYLKKHINVLGGDDGSGDKATNRKNFLLNKHRHGKMTKDELVRIRDAFKQASEADNSPLFAPSSSSPPASKHFNGNVSSSSTMASPFAQSTSPSVESSATFNSFLSTKMSNYSDHNDKIQNIIRTEDRKIDWEKPENNMGIIPFMCRSIDYKGEDVDVISLVSFVKDPIDVSRTKLIASDNRTAVDLRVSILQ